MHPDDRRRRRRVAELLAALVLVALALAAVYADLGRDLSIAEAVSDSSVGVAFGLGAWFSARPQTQRVLVALAGVGWLLASLVSLSAVPLLSRGAILAMIVAFPVGRITDRLRSAAAILGAALLLLDRPEATIVALVVVALACARDVRRLTDWATYPVVAGLAIAAVQAAFLIVFNSPALADTAKQWILIYEAVLVLVALGHAPASRLAERERTSAVLLRLQRPADPDGDPLVTALREALDDPGLELLRWNDSLAAFVTSTGDAVQARPPWVEVNDGDRPLALVASASPLLTDVRTATQVSDAVRLAVRAQHRQNERDAQLRELEAARRRLLIAADQQRRLVAGRLAGDVLPPLRDAATLVASVGTDDETLRVVDEELAAAEVELARLVAGVAPADLGGGRLPAALTGLAQRSHVRTEVVVDSGWYAGVEVEETLYYVAAEALTNALKHAEASTILVTLASRAGVGRLEIRDDGRGGARAQGTGLVGLADRVATAGGRLTVSDVDPHGTCIRAEVPLAE